MTTEPCEPDDLPCQEAVELVTDYLESALDQDTLIRLEHHLSICEACRTYFDQIRLVVTGLSALPPPSLTPQARQEIVAAFAQVRGRS